MKLVKGTLELVLTGSNGQGESVVAKVALSPKVVNSMIEDPTRLARLIMRLQKRVNGLAVEDENLKGKPWQMTPNSRN